MTRILIALACALLLTGCGASKFKTYEGPEVTRIVVQKEARLMHLVHHNVALRTYKIGLGFAPEGHKQIEGDGRTPEGTYYIDRRNPESNFHLSLGISYPNAADRAYAQALGESPGGDIFIHGRPNPGSGIRARKGDDWTWGCIAVTNRQMEEIYAMVRDGTPISIRP